MAFRTEVATVTFGTPALVYTAVAGDLEVYVTTSATVQVGGDAADAVQGPSVSASGVTWFRFDVRPGDELWADKGSTGSATVKTFVRSA